MIKRENERLKKNLDFQNAFFNYVGHTIMRGQLAELLGELVSEEHYLTKNIENYIANQEKEE